MKKPILFAVLFVMVLASVAAVLQSGWTGTTVPSVARTALGVPGLTNNNVFTGSNWIAGSFTGNLNGATNFNSSNLVGTVWGGISNPATGGDKMTVLASGSIGIGTTSPTNKLDVWGSVGTNYGSLGALRVFDTTSAAANTGGELLFSGYYNGTSSASDGIASIKAFKLNSTAANYSFDLGMATRANGGLLTEVMRLTSAGNVGIGTTGPMSKLTVYGDVIGVQGGSVLGGNGYTGKFVQLGYDTGFDLGFLQSGEWGAAYKPFNFNASSVRFLIAAVEIMRVDNSGNVGIGTTTPTSGKLVVAGSITADSDDTGGIGAVGANRFNNIQIGTGDSAFAGQVSIRTNIAQFDVTIANFVIGTRYTNALRRSFVAASFQLAAAVAGTAAVTMSVEQAGTTNKLTVSSGPLAGLTTIEPLSLLVGPGAFYYFTDTSSGAGAVASIVAGTSSKTEF